MTAMVCHLYIAQNITKVCMFLKILRRGMSVGYIGYLLFFARICLIH